ncbi:hypothetical protein IAS59_001700 [Cryptococcus gattii]
MVFVRAATRSLPRTTKRYASTVPPAGSTPSTSGSSNNNGLLLGGGAIAAVGLYFYYLNNKKKVDQKAEDLKDKTKHDLEDARQRTAKALK